MAYVYRHIRKDKNIPFYIGIGSDSNGEFKRAYSKKSRNLHWKNIVNKTDYEIEIMLDDLSWEEACEKEREFIQLYGREDLGKGTLTNLTDGGDGVHNLSKKIKTQISDSLIKYYKDNTEARKHLSDISRLNSAGEKNGMFGKGYKLMGEKNGRFGGKGTTEETRKKIRDSKLNTKATEQTKKKMSLKKSGKNNSMYGTNQYKIWIEKFGEKEANRLKEEHLKKLSLVNLNTKMINDGIITKRVKKDILQYYLAQGWKMGRVKK